MKREVAVGAVLQVKQAFAVETIPLWLQRTAEALVCPKMISTTGLVNGLRIRNARLLRVSVTQTWAPVGSGAIPDKVVQLMDTPDWPATAKGGLIVRKG